MKAGAEGNQSPSHLLVELGKTSEAASGKPRLAGRSRSSLGRNGRLITVFPWSPHEYTPSGPVFILSFLSLICSFTHLRHQFLMWAYNGNRHRCHLGGVVVKPTRTHILLAFYAHLLYFLFMFSYSLPGCSMILRKRIRRKSRWRGKRSDFNLGLTACRTLCPVCPGHSIIGSFSGSVDSCWRVHFRDDKPELRKLST